MSLTKEDAKEFFVMLFGEKLCYRPEKVSSNELLKYIEVLKDNLILWHDLEKNPDDLPNGHKVVLSQVGAPTTYDPDKGFLGFEGAGIKAWCEIPIYNKEYK